MAGCRRVVAVALGAVLNAPAIALAATIYGTIQENGAARSNVEVGLACDGNRIVQRTDARGTYRFSLPRTGHCALDVQGASTRIVVYDEPTRYDFELRRGSGRPTLVRR